MYTNSEQNDMVISKKLSKIYIFFCFTGYLFSLIFSGKVFVGRVFVVSLCDLVATSMISSCTINY